MNHLSNSYAAKGGKLVLPGKLEEMKTNPMTFSKPRCSNNLTKLSMKKKENLVA